MEIECTQCRLSSATGGCQTCRKGTYCENCHWCSNPQCDTRRQVNQGPQQQGFGQPVFVFGQQPQPLAPSKSEENSNLPAYDLNEQRKLFQMLWGITDDEPPPKTTRKRTLEDTGNSKLAAPRGGQGVNSISSISTFSPPPFEISVASWNVNHFQKEEQKKGVLRFLFDKHPWLDVVVLQEVNDAGKEKLVAALDGWGEIGYRLGPMMQGLSSSEDGPVSVTEKDAQAGKCTIGGQNFACQTYTKVKSFQLKDSTGTWVWMRPNQPEFYPILFRKDRISVKNCWATYDGTTKRAEEPLYWAKETHRRTLLTMDEDDDTTSALSEKRLTKALKRVLEVTEESEVKFGRTSSSKGSQKKKTPPYRTWRVTVDEEDYEITAQEGTITVCGCAPVISARCRPVIVYEVEVKSGTRKHTVFLGVVHTTPNGSKMNRAGEMLQVRQLFAAMGNSGDYWIAAGDYYLDPESPVEGKRSKKSQRERLFQSVLDECGLRIVVSLSATNQSTVNNYNPLEFKDQVERKIQNPTTKVEETKRVLNKRADFLVCNDPFGFTFGGVFSPSSGLLVVDPMHNALNWWAAISDHAPVGGILSTGSENRCRKYFQHQIVHEKPIDYERMRQMEEQVKELHIAAVYELSHLQRLLLESIERNRYKWVDVSSAMEDIDDRLESQKLSAKKKKTPGPTFELKVPSSLDSYFFPILSLQKLLVLVIDNVLCDGYVQQFGPKRTPFDKDGFLEDVADFDSGILVAWMRFWSTMPTDYLMEIRDQSLQILVSLTLEILQALRQINIQVDDADLVPEAETYQETGKLMFEKGASQ